METKFKNNPQEYELIHNGIFIASDPDINVIDAIKLEIKDQKTSK